MNRIDRRIAAWIALLLFGFYLLTYSGRIHSYDGMSMFSVTESFVKRGEFDTSYFWTLFKARDELAPNGESYAKYGYGASLFGAPLYALALYLPGELGLTQTTVLSSGIAIAIAGALLYLLTRELGFSPRTSLIVTLIFGLATQAFVYARQFWSEPFSLATLWAAFFWLFRFRRSVGDRQAFAAGCALGLAVATRVTNAALIPFFAWYGFSDALHDSRARRGLIWYACALGVFVLSIAWYDWVRFGNPLVTGYRANETFDNPILLGLYGLLFSPGKGLFVYVPFLAVLPFSLPIFFNHAKRETLLSLFVFSLYLLTFSLWYYWWDGTNWASRFLVPTLPFLTLLTAPAIELVSTPNSARSLAQIFFAVITGTLALVSLGIQILGVSIPPLTYWLRMYQTGISPERILFLPNYSPFLVYFDLLKPKSLDLAWVRMIDNSLTVDWLVVALTLAFIAFCVIMLYRTRFAIRHSPFAIPLAIVLIVALSLFSLYRYRGDTIRFGGSDGYRVLLQTIARQEQPHDVMILNNDLVAPFFLNENRTRMRWYGLSRDPKQFDAATVTLLTRLTQQYTRVWFAYDDAASDLPDPTRDWLDQSLTIIAEHDFDDGVHLILYETGLRP